ncbi:MAG TPA: diguanylate cyclase [Desulfurivibrionaceae bacterium]|nr:diguanylate cyclase [Desulfurivibrionaceae bacterium]
MTYKKILVVDNNPVILRLMTGFLEKEGHEVRTASDGLSALYLLESFVPEVIFTDLVMPNIDGEKLCRIVRDMPALAGVFLVVLSGIAAEEAIDYKAFGADACIAKGTADNIKKHVLDLLREADQRSDVVAEDAPSTLGVGEIHTREVTRELLMSKRHFEAIVQHLADGIFELTREGRIVYANETAVELTGIKEEKLLASDFRDLFPEEVQRRLSHALVAASETPQGIDEDPPLLVNQSYVALTLLPVANEKDLSIIAMMHDITRRVLDAKALNASETRFRELFDHMLAGVAVYESNNGKDFIFVDFNRAAERIDRIDRAAVLGRNATEVFPGIEKFGLLEVMRRVWQSGRTEEHPLSFYEDDRMVGWRENYVYKLPSGEVVAIYRDVTDQKRAEENLAFESEINEAVARLSQMLIAADSLADISSVLLEHAMKLTGSTSGFVGYLDDQGQLQTLAITANQKSGRKARVQPLTIKKPTGLFGWVLKKRESVLTNEPDRDPRHNTPPEGHIPIRRFLAAPAMLGRELIGQVALANSDRDYTDRDLAVVKQLASLYALTVDKQRNEEQIAHLAHHDPLTGLANRHLLPDRLEQATRLARRHSKQVAVLFMDLDKFKEINDTRGHSVGDEVLREVANRFAQGLRASDTIARMGGDEFVVILQDIKEAGNAATVANKLLALLDQPLAALGGTNTVRGSIGISMYPADGANGEQLLQRADEAMYRAKQKGGGFAFYAEHHS